MNEFTMNFVNYPLSCTHVNENFKANITCSDFSNHSIDKNIYATELGRNLMLNKTFQRRKKR